MNDIKFDINRMGLLNVSEKKPKNSDSNPWAVCHTTVDKDADPEKFERCVHHVKDDQRDVNDKKKKKKTDKKASAADQEWATQGADALKAANFIIEALRGDSGAVRSPTENPKELMLTNNMIRSNWLPIFRRIAEDSSLLGSLRMVSEGGFERNKALLQTAVAKIEAYLADYSPHNAQLVVDALIKSEQMVRLLSPLPGGWRPASTLPVMKKEAGEDWIITDEIKHLAAEVFLEVSNRGGVCDPKGENSVIISQMPLGGKITPGHFEIELFDGTYYPGKVLINAYFFHGGQKYPLPVRDRIEFDAAAVVDAVDAAFMSLVNHGRKSSVKKPVKLSSSKILKQANGTVRLGLSHEDWIRVGLSHRWMTERQAEMSRSGKWGKDTKVPESEKGKWTNHSLEELKSKLDAAKERQDKRDKADPKDTSLIRKLQFAVRAKQKGNGQWGPVKD